ncbi:MAG: SIS domain-containing protein [Roseibacillus sp.]
MNGNEPTSSSPPGSLERFLEVASDFQLGALETEQPRAETADLSRMAREDLGAAVEILKGIDEGALAQLEGYLPQIEVLAKAIGETLTRGKRIFLCGCGATGRLSISLEFFAGEGLLGEGLAGQVIGFMAGGDAALVRAIERFEDFPEYGARQLQELGFEEGDLMVGITEGGETPFVIGATEAAARQSANRPFFLYCNPDEVLAEVAPRSKRVLENDAIRKTNLTVGPMAITGSTRMQASTVQMAAVGWALACHREPGRVGEYAVAFGEWVAESDWSFLPELIACEASAYDEGRFVLYEPGVFGITVLTDTTERSPTFSLPPFENVQRSEDAPSWCYLHVEADTAAEAWESLLGREPRTLAWGGLEHLTGEGNLLGFDFSNEVVARRAALGEHLKFTITNRRLALALGLGDLSFDFPVEGQDLFSRHLLLKLLLNAHSTLVMGRRGRFAGNVMTHVNATNNKLIDRAIRYVRILLDSRHGLQAGYEEVARALFEVRASLAPDEPIVLQTVAWFLERQGK